MAYLSLEGVDDSDVPDLVLRAMGASGSGLYVLFKKSTVVDTSFLDLLGTLYGQVALREPRYNLVPLLPRCGWTQDTGQILVSTGARPVTPDLLTNGTGGDGATLMGDVLEKRTQVLGREGGASSTALHFAHVALGGTFDRLHAGHRLLLAAAAAITSQEIYIGITGDKLLESKVHKELIHPYDSRLYDVSEFVSSVHPSLKQTFLPLLDPQESTRAETSADVSAIVVSEETIKGAHSINAGREARGLAPLTIVVVPVLHAMSHGEDKLSSTALRAREAALVEPI